MRRWGDASELVSSSAVSPAIAQDHKTKAPC
jgi:hypothetical protein